MSVHIDILRGTDVIARIAPDNNSIQQKKVMGDNVVSLSFEMNYMANFQIGDYAVIYNEQYYINKIPTVQKVSTYNYKYDTVLQSSQYELSKAQFLFLGDDNTLKEGEFSLLGTAETFVDLIRQNANRVSPTWYMGGVIQTGYKNLTFSRVNCLQALQQVAEAFDTEFYCDGKRIHLAKQQRNTGYEFKYGRNKGLYDITRTQLDNPVITRLYPFGGTTNIPNDYRNFSPRLLLPDDPEEHLISNLTVDVNEFAPQTIFSFWWTAPKSPTVTSVIVYRRLTGTTTWTARTVAPNAPPKLILPTGTYDFYFQSVTTGGNFDTEIITVSSSIVAPIFTGAMKLYLDKNTDNYGIIEASLLMDDIYPDRIGKVTSVDATNVYKFRDTTLDFDINDYLLPGLAAKVTFNTGQLTGYTFEILKFDLALKEFTILKNKDEKTLDIPSMDLRYTIGDEYVLTDMRLPQSYVDAAEQKLLKKATEYLDKNSSPQYNYSVNCDPKTFRKNKIKINIGDIVKLTDIELQVQKSIRVIGLTKNLIDEYNYTLELGEIVAPGTIAQLQSAQSQTSTEVQNVSSVISNNKLLAGTNIGDFNIEQGTIKIKDIETASDVSAMKLLYIDANGKVWKSA